jgi:hypothetical protein
VPHGWISLFHFDSIPEISYDIRNLCPGFGPFFILKLNISISKSKFQFTVFRFIIVYVATV